MGEDISTEQKKMAGLQLREKKNKHVFRLDLNECKEGFSRRPKKEKAPRTISGTSTRADLMV